MGKSNSILMEFFNTITVLFALIFMLVFPISSIYMMVSVYFYPLNLILLIPMIGISLSAPYYFFRYFIEDRQSERPNRLDFIDAIILTLYLICLLVILMTLVDPLNSYFLFSFVLSSIYYFYPFSIFALIFVLIYNIYGLRISEPISKKKLIIHLVILVVIIFLFIGIYFVLYKLIPSLQMFYASIENFMD